MKMKIMKMALEPCLGGFPSSAFTMFLLLLLIFLVSNVYGNGSEETLSTHAAKSTSSPLLVFGILTQPYYDDDYDENDVRLGNGDHGDPDDRDYNRTYVAASYVKWLEDAGARSIPIPYDASPSLAKDILGQVDGILFPGGASELPTSAITIWEQLHGEHYYYPANESAAADMIPLWGTCLGFEYIVQLAADSTETETECGYRCNRNILEKGFDSTNISLPLLDVGRNGLYRPDAINDIVTGYNVTMNNHHLGISPERFRNNSGLSRRFDITSVNYDLNGKAFVSTIEPSRQHTTETSSSSSSSTTSIPPPPIYGVQYHPEKNTHEYGFYPQTTIPYEAIDHSPEGIAFSLYEARFLVDLARDNANARSRRRSFGFGGDEESQNHQNANNKYTKPDVYPMIYTYPRKVGYKFEEGYIIPRASHWEHDETNNEPNDSSDRNAEKAAKPLLNPERKAATPTFLRKPKVPQERAEK